MSELLYGSSNEIAAWVAQRIPHMNGREFGVCEAIGVVSSGKLIAGVVFHDYQQDYATMQLSMAAENPMWARRENLKALLAYPFEQLGVFKLWTATPHRNDAALRVNRHIGFKKEATLAHQFGQGTHCVVCRMLKPDYTRLFGG